MACFYAHARSYSSEFLVFFILYFGSWFGFPARYKALWRSGTVLFCFFLLLLGFLFCFLFFLFFHTRRRRHSQFHPVSDSFPSRSLALSSSLSLSLFLSSFPPPALPSGVVLQFPSSLLRFSRSHAAVLADLFGLHSRVLSPAPSLRIRLSSSASPLHFFLFPVPPPPATISQRFSFVFFCLIARSLCPASLGLD